VRRILILENYPSTRQALAVTLRRAGWEVTLVETDHEAVTILEQEAYDILLLDVDVPTGDGWRVLQALQAAHHSIPVVALIGMEGKSRQRALALGACLVLAKPVGRKTLLAGVRTALKYPRGNEKPSLA
jgi:DNA-binding response OmpR family regulator